MSPELWSIVALVAVVIIGTTMNVNLGLLAVAAAFLLATTVADIDSAELYLMFPGDIFIMLVSLVFLLGIARVQERRLDSHARVQRHEGQGRRHLVASLCPHWHRPSAWDRLHCRSWPAWAPRSRSEHDQPAAEEGRSLSLHPQSSMEACSTASTMPT